MLQYRGIIKRPPALGAFEFEINYLILDWLNLEVGKREGIRGRGRVGGCFGFGWGFERSRKSARRKTGNSEEEEEEEMKEGRGKREKGKRKIGERD